MPTNRCVLNVLPENTTTSHLRLLVCPVQPGATQIILSVCRLVPLARVAPMPSMAPLYVIHVLLVSTRHLLAFPSACHVSLVPIHPWAHPRVKLARLLPLHLHLPQIVLFRGKFSLRSTYIKPIRIYTDHCLSN